MIPTLIVFGLSRERVDFKTRTGTHCDVVPFHVVVVKVDPWSLGLWFGRVLDLPDSHREKGFRRNLDGRSHFRLDDFHRTVGPAGRPEDDRGSPTEENRKGSRVKRNETYESTCGFGRAGV